MQFHFDVFQFTLRDVHLYNVILPSMLFNFFDLICHFSRMERVSPVHFCRNWDFMLQSIMNILIFVRPPFDSGHYTHIVAVCHPSFVTARLAAGSNVCHQYTPVGHPDLSESVLSINGMWELEFGIVYFSEVFVEFSLFPESIADLLQVSGIEQAQFNGFVALCNLYGEVDIAFCWFFHLFSSF